MGLPVEVNNLMIGAVGGYQISRSLRFRSSASAYLSRAPATATNRTTFTLSAWVKRGKLGGSSLQSIFGNANGVNLAFYFGFSSNDVIDLHQYDNGTNVLNILTTPVYRDPSAWYHILASVDTTQATASNRAKVYVNGVEVTALGTATYPTQNYSLTWNQTNAHVIGSGYNGASPTGFLFDGCLAEVYNIDGQALTPSSFGETDPITGVWNPKKYTGTYGTNGFYLNFSDNSAATAAAIGKDSSGNGNNWTPNNISVTAGTTYDSMIDSPTPYADGGNGRGNYATWNPIFAYGNQTFSNSNLTLTTGTSGGSIGTISVSSGKWYWEVYPTSVASAARLAGLTKTTVAATSLLTSSVYWQQNGTYLINNGGTVAYGTSSTASDVIGVALDVDAQTVIFYKNGSAMGSAISISSVYSAGDFVTPSMVQSGGVSQTISTNFGQQPFSYTPPSGYKALNTYNLPSASISNGAKHFAATLWTGNGPTGQSIVNSGGFQPDLVWAKSRSAIAGHSIYDSVRGVRTLLQSNTTNTDYADASGTGLTAFNSNGFTVGADTASTSSINANGYTFVGWQWKGGGTGVSNNSGTITSTVSANTTAGFSIVTYTGSGANATVGHGLGVAPSMIIVKNRTSGTAENWQVYHQNMAASPQTNQLLLNSTAAIQAATVWNSTAPTSSVFSISGGAPVGASTNTYVAYCFAAVRGYSAFGSYTGNGSTDGPFIYLGFRPRFIMIKRTDTTMNWYIFDTSRDTYNVEKARLFPNLSDAESTNADFADYLSNGFKLRSSDISWNASGGTYIYAAFAESPFNLSRAR